MKVLVVTYDYGSPLPVVGVFADRQAIVDAHDDEFAQDLADAADTAIAHPGELVDLGDGDTVTYMTIIGTEEA